MQDFQNRLDAFLISRNIPFDVTLLTPDASTREYFRIGWHGVLAVACVYPEPFCASEQSYLDVSELFRRGGLPVADVFDFDEKLGVIIVEDLGDRILRDTLTCAAVVERERLTDQAILLISRIQAATRMAFETDSIASRLRFDAEKLNWELQYFKTHYFGTLRKKSLKSEVETGLDSEFQELSLELEKSACTLCHRDFHAANLMIDKRGDLRIIDHQDARIGPASYDLVSLLLDRVTETPPAEMLAEKRRFFLAARESLGLEKIDEAEFTTEFRLMAIQRCLKAAGTFSFQSAARGLTRYQRFIDPMFRIALSAIIEIGRFPTIRKVLEAEVV